MFTKNFSVSYFLEIKRRRCEKMEGKSMKLKMVSLAWCESRKGLKRERERSAEEALYKCPPKYR